LSNIDRFFERLKIIEYGDYGCSFTPEMITGTSLVGPSADNAICWVHLTLLALITRLPLKWKECYQSHADSPLELEAILVDIVRSDLGPSDFDDDGDLHNFLSSLLAPKHERMSCEQALSHPWIIEGFKVTGSLTGS